MKTFIYTVEFNKKGRSGGRKYVVKVWIVRFNFPSFIGSESGNTASWDGARLIAHRIAAAEFDLALNIHDRIPEDEANVIELLQVQK